jgi:hypothetical protein
MVIIGWWLKHPSTMVEMVAGEINNPVILIPVVLVAGESVNL